MAIYKDSFRNLIFDFEVFPKWWCVVTKVPDEDTYDVITSDDDDYMDKLRNMTYKTCLIGFNCKGYDLRILNAIQHKYTPAEVHELSTAIVTDTPAPLNDYSYWNKYIFTDLYDDWFGTLKEFESNIGMSIKESDVSFDKVDLTPADKEEIIKYCKHDVYATDVLKKHRQVYLDSKVMISEMFNIPYITTLRSTNAKLCALVLQAKQQNRYQQIQFKIPERVKDYVYSNLPKEIIDMFGVFNKENKYANLFDNEVVFGIGGIHSTCGDNTLAIADENYKLINIDVTSYYPNLIIHFDYMSRNVPNPAIYEEIYEQRLAFKKQMKAIKDDPTKKAEYYDYFQKQEALKLILNTTYGAMKNEYNALYDPQQASSICYLGQLLLASLANNLHNKLHATIIQTNTDGILIKIHKDYELEMKAMVNEWETMTGLTMEYDYIQIFFQRDVNNYIEVPVGAKNIDQLKVKGKWTNQENYNPNDKKRKLTNLNAPITHNAILNHYVFGKPVEDTINECDDVYMFCFTAKTGHNYDKTYYEYGNDKLVANKVNRVVATTNTNCGTLYKYKKAHIDEETNKLVKERFDKVAEIPEHCMLVNDDLTSVPMELMDKQWYIDFAKNKIKELRVV